MAKKIDVTDKTVLKEAFLRKLESSGTIFSFTHKTCPICKVSRPIYEYDLQFSNKRNKHRLGAYCILCARKEAKKRALTHYKEHKEEKKQYARDFRANQNNKEKIQTESKKYKAKYRENLQDCYLRDKLVTKYGFNRNYLNEHPEIVEMYRVKVKISRTLKSVKDSTND